MVQLIALDLDDTLLTSDLEISPRNRAAISEARLRGIRIVLASGRSPSAMARFAETLNLFDRPGHLISDNGSTITSTQPREVLISHRLHQPLFHELLAFFRQVDLPVQVYTETQILVTRDNELTHHDVGLSGFAGRTVMAEMETELGFLPSKLVIPGAPEVLPGVLTQLKERFGPQINTFISKPYFLEVLPVQADKGTSLKWIVEQLGFSRENVMAFGDAGNDLGMLKYAGWSVAMANAIPSVKAVARQTTQADHNHDGVAEVIETVWKDA